MGKIIDVYNDDKKQRWVQRVRRCQSFICRLRGLTFRRELPEDVGLLLVEGAMSRIGTAIHMFAVMMPLGVAWLDKQQRVVDLKVAQPWRIYFPSEAACYILEGDPSMIESLAVGDHLTFIEIENEEDSIP